MASALAIWSLSLFRRQAGKPKTAGVYKRYPNFARLFYIWVLLAALLAFRVPRSGVLGTSRHAFTAGFLAILIFAIGPRILPSFLNSRQLRSPRLMGASLMLITAGCAASDFGTASLRWDCVHCMENAASVCVRGTNCRPPVRFQPGDESGDADPGLV